MVSTVEPSRRGFLKSAASLALLALMRPRELLAGTAAAEPPFEARLVALLRRRDSAAEIGRAYLRSGDEPADASAMAAAIARDAGIEPGEAAARDPLRLRRALALRTRRDFAEGRTVRVEGWILSRTEARLYAIASLI
jgi:hypothetical protein